VVPAKSISTPASRQRRTMTIVVTRLRRESEIRRLLIRTEDLLLVSVS
jgi:hypothetical protein